MLSLDSVRKNYGARVALDALTLALREGEILGLLGPNGAGKSTLMHLAAGLLAPDAGSVRVGGRDPREAAVRSRIGVAPQSLSLYLELTGRENLEFTARLFGLRGAALRERVDAALDFVGLAERARERVATWSGGMQRRLNIACAIVHAPALVLLDEPTVGVDPQSRNAIFDNVLALRARGATVLYSTHYMEEAQRLCDRVAVLDHGRLLALDTPEALVRAHGGPAVVRYARDGAEHALPTDEPLAALNALAAQGPLTEFRVERPSLEQVFLNLTGRSLRDA